MNLPNLIIAGVTKAGTTSLFTYLSGHPEICGSTKKEICYFLPIRFGKSIAPIEEYSRYFAKCHGQRYVMEASPAYFFGGKELAHQIKETLPEVKIILLLRNPVDRCISFFKFHKSMLNLPKHIKLREYISKCERFHSDDFKQEENHIYYGLLSGVYSQFMEGWLGIFGNDLRVFFFEELKRDPKNLLAKICDWLGVGGDYYSDYDLVIENKTRKIRFESLQNVALRFNRNFERFFREHLFAKRILRYFYFLINESHADEEIDGFSLEYLKDYYRPFNQELSALLRRYNYEDMPNW